MPRSTPGLVRVAIFGLDGALISRARAALEPVTTGAGNLPLEFNTALGGHIAKGVSPGSYRLVVSADGLESERREVLVGKEGLEQTVILGRRGLPFYYRGSIRVPYEPLPLIGVSFAGPPGDIDLKATEIGGRFQLRSQPVSKSIAGSRVRVFRAPTDTGLDRIAEMTATMTAQKDVRHAGPVVAFGEDSVAFLTNEFVVKFKPAIGREEATAMMRRLNLAVRHSIPYVRNGFLAQARDAGNGLAACNTLVESGSVEYAEPNLVITVRDDSIIPTDFLYSRQWHLPLINVPDAWAQLCLLNAPGVVAGGAGDLTFGNENITIAIFDRGIPSRTVGGIVQPAHPDFDGTVTNGAPKISQYFDFAAMVPNNDNTVNNHGINCAGLATALANNPAGNGETEGVVGVAPNCRVLAISRDDGATETLYADAYMWIAGLDPNNGDPAFPPPLAPGIGADVISSSFGMGNTIASNIVPISGVMTDCFDALTSQGRDGKGTVLCFSTGNNPFFDFRLQRPWAGYPAAIAVAATDGGVKASFSPFGTGIDVCAPGKNGLDGLVTSDLPGAGVIPGHTGGASDYTDDFIGTSAATPLVAGVAALVLSADPGLTSTEVLEILCSTAVKIDPGNTNAVGKWVDTDGDGVNDYSQWYGCGLVNAKAAVAKAIESRAERAAILARSLVPPTNVRIIPTDERKAPSNVRIIT